MFRRRWWPAMVMLLFLCSACGQERDARNAAPLTPSPVGASTPVETATSSPSQSAEPVLMPDLVGLPDRTAGGRIGSLEAKADLGLTSHWQSQLVTDCDSRPHTVVAQEPSAGTPLGRRTEIQVWSARLDLARFRGPCQPKGGELGPVLGAEAEVARQFYRFAADPSLGDPFVEGEVWHGIEDGPLSDDLDAVERQDLSAWQLRGTYAESFGPFSALDMVAGSGGYYEVHRGIVPTCPVGNDKAPPELAGLRAVTLTAPIDTVSACSQAWGVTLFLADGRVRGVALRSGSP